MTQKDLLIIFGNRLRKIRLSKDISQTELATICKFEKSTLSKIESGQVNISYYTLYRISVGLEVSICKLISQEPIS